MAHDVLHGGNTRNNLLDSILLKIDSGATNGYIELLDTDVQKAKLIFQVISGVVDNALHILNFDCTDLKDQSVQGGIIDSANFRNGDDEIIISCTAGIGTDFDVSLTNDVFGTGDTVHITELNYTPPL